MKLEIPEIKEKDVLFLPGKWKKLVNNIWRLEVKNRVIASITNRKNHWWWTNDPEERPYDSLDEAKTAVEKAMEVIRDRDLKPKGT